MNQPTDAEKLRVTLDENENIRRNEHKVGQEIQHHQLKVRKASREALQYSSAQSLSKTADVHLAKELNLCKPEISTEFTMQRPYVDPSKSESLCPVF
jgi:predicted component of type VI protein secretion system